MKILTACSLILLCLLILNGCKAKYKDISLDDRYSHLVGQQYELLSFLYILGVNDYGSQDKTRIDLYTVNNFSFGGHEILSEGTLNKGSVIRIIKVRSCTNCLFQKSIKYEISILSQSSYQDIEAPVYLSDTKNDMVVTDQNGRVELDPAVFKQQSKKSKQSNQRGQSKTY